MIHHSFENSKQLIQFLFIWLLYALIQALVFYWLIQLPFWVLLVDGVFHASIFAALCILIQNVIKYGNFAALQLYQQIVNHIALAILSLTVWQIISYGTFYALFGRKYTSLTIPTLPISTFIGLLIYIIIIQKYRSNSTKTEDKCIPLEILPTTEDIYSKAMVETEKLERVVVKSGTKINVILIPEILYLQADGDYVHIFTLKGKYMKEQTLKYYNEHLSESQFVRVHRSTIVNVEMISSIELYEKQTQTLTLKNGQQIKTSPTGYNTLRKVLKL